MAQHTWTFDAPTGVYKSHTLSNDIRVAAVEDSVFMEHVSPVSGFGKGKGDTVTITRVANIAEPTSATLSETDRIPEDSFSLSTHAITVDELGRAVPYTSLSDDLSEFDLENPIQKKLKEQMKLVLDTKAATAAKTTPLRYQVTGAASGTFTTNSAFGGASSDNMNVFHLEEISDTLYDTYQVPPASGDDYIGIFRTLALRGIKRDPAWEEWKKYTDPQAKFNSEVGRMERIRLVQTNHADALAKVGTGSVLGEGIVFGDDFLVMAEAMAPELRAAIPGDFGRSKAVAWYGILSFGLAFGTSANAGEVRGVYVGST